MTAQKTACFLTLGCRLNQADTALMTGLLETHGYRVIDAPTKTTEILIINTCAVTATAAQKSRQAVRRLRQKYNDAAVIATGCGVNVDPEAWQQEPAVDLVLAPARRAELPLILAEWFATRALPAPFAAPAHTPNSPGAHTYFSEGNTSMFPFKTRAFLKIQDGCNNFCSYCIVPYARGPQRSRELAEIIADFKTLLARGHKEIVLTGVNTCTFRSEAGGLPHLLATLAAEPGEFRLRISSAEPHPVIPEVLSVMRDTAKVCRFLHLPAQHLADPMLKRMNRHYTLDTYIKYIEQARSMIPDIHIGTDFIVGFPGETEAEFDTALATAAQLEFANMHIFPFSAREGTVAAALKQTSSGAEIKARIERLKGVAEKGARHFAESQIGKTFRVLTETIEDQTAEGWSDHYLRVRYPAADTEKGELVSVTPTCLDDILSV